MLHILLIACIMAGSHHLLAQGFSLGVLAGVNAGKTYISGDFGKMMPFEPMLGYSMNLHTGYRSGSFWGVSAEPGVISKGYRDDQLQPFTVQLVYLNMPLLFNVHFLKHLSLSVGPEPAYLVSSDIRTNGRPIQSRFPTDYEQFELSGMVGIQYNVFDNLDIGLRYSRAFTPNTELRFTDSFGSTIIHEKAYNQYLQLLLRYRFISGEAE